MNDDALKSAGQALKRERERLGLSIKDISTSTKINSRVLIALEQGDLSALPAKPFARGFLRSYAQYLKIDPQPLVDAFDFEDAFLTNDGRVAPEQVGAPPSPTDETVIQMQSNKLGPKVWFIVAAFVLIGLIFGVKKIVDKYAQERHTESVVVPENKIIESKNEPNTATLDKGGPSPSAEIQIVEAPAPPTSAATESTKSTPTPTVASIAAVTPTSAPTTAPSAAPTKAPTPAPTSVPTPSPTPTKVPTPTAMPTAAKPSPTPATASSVKTSQEVIIEALDQVKIQVRIDGESKASLELKPESVHSIKAKESIELEISDGGLVNIIHNGKDRGNPGDLGKPVKVKIP
jgi:cytoskeleton protein RodZ